MDQVIQIVGALLILVAFAAVQFDACAPTRASTWRSTCRLGDPRRARRRRRAVGLRPARERLGDRLAPGGCGVALFGTPLGTKGARRLSRRSPPAAPRGVSSRARAPPRRRRPSRSARPCGRFTPASRSVAMSLKASRSSRPSISAPRSAGRRSRIAPSRIASSEPCSLQQLRRRLRPDALGARQPVGGVAAQGDEVGDQLGVDPVALAHLRRADLFGAFAAGPDVEHGHVLGRALVHVAVAGQQQRPAAGLGLAAARRCRAGRRPRGPRRSSRSSRRPRRTRASRRTGAAARRASPPRARRGRRDRARSGRRPRRGRSRAPPPAARAASTSRRIRFAVPSSALTGRPSGPTILLGSA